MIDEDKDDDDEYIRHDPATFKAKQKAMLAEAPQRLGLSPATIEKMRGCRFDRFLEKHEGPESWDSFLRFYTLIMHEVDGYQVLLPLERKHHKNITILRCVPSQDRQILTIFLKDTTYSEGAEMDWYDAYRIAICEKFPAEEFYLTTFYHAWYQVEPLAQQLEKPWSVRDD